MHFRLWARRALAVAVLGAAYPQGECMRALREHGIVVALMVVVIGITIWWGFGLLDGQSVLETVSQSPNKHVGTALGLEGGAGVAPAMTLSDWGGSFAFMSAIFTSLAFAAAWLAWRTQERTLKKMARDSAEQSFRDGFFKMIDLINARKERPIYLMNLSGKREGVALSQYMSDLIPLLEQELHQLARERGHGQSADIWQSPKFAKRFVSHYDTRYAPHMSEIFRMSYILGRMLRDASFLSQEQRLDYARILRSQFSQHEVLCWGINGLCQSSADLKGMLERLHLLKYAQSDAAPQLSQWLRLQYAAEAFGSEFARA